MGSQDVEHVRLERLALNGDKPRASGKRYTFLLPNLGVGGAERVALRLIIDSLASGHETDLVLAQANGALLPLVPAAVRVIDLRAERIRSVVMPLRAYLRERQPDAVHIMMWPLTIAGIFAWRLAGSKCRIVVSDHSTLGRQYNTSRRSLAILSLTTRIFYPMADKVLCVSHESADDLARLSGLDRATIEVIYNPVANPTLPIAVPPPIEAQWGEDCVRILTVGSLKPVKNHAMLIRAFARLAKRRPAKLMIVGEGPTRGELEQVAAAEGVADRVIMPGFTLDPWPYYASADLFVLSSDHEGFSLVIVEAMRCGLNVVSTDCLSGPRELLSGGEFGALTEVGNDARMAEAMEEMLDHPIAAEKLQARAETLSGPATSARHLTVMSDPRGDAGVKPEARSNSFFAMLVVLFGRVRGSMLISGSVVSMAVRVGGMAIGFGSHILLSRLLGVSAYGSYVIALGWVMILVVVARLGLDNVALRFATNYREEGRGSEFRGFKRFSLLSILGASCLIGTLGFAAKIVGLVWLDNVSFAMLAWTALLTAALALLGWYAALLRTAHQIFLGQAYEQMLRPALLVAAVGAVMLTGTRLSAPGAMALTFGSAMAALVGIALHSRRYFVAMRGDDARYTERSDWLSMGRVLFMMAICQEAINQFGIILLGLLSTVTDAAHFSAAARLASFVPFALAAIVSVSGPMIASAHRRSDQVALARIAKVSARFALVYALGLALALLVFGRWMLAAFGPSFVAAYPCMMVLVIGGLINAATGAVGYFLALTANHKTALRIVLGALILNMVANAILIPTLGIMGGAIASTAVVSYWNLAMVWSVRRRVGIDASAIGFRPRKPNART